MLAGNGPRALIAPPPPFSNVLSAISLPVPAVKPFTGFVTSLKAAPLSALVTHIKVLNKYICVILCPKSALKNSFLNLLYGHGYGYRTALY
jgi:hypothetical protein